MGYEYYFADLPFGLCSCDKESKNWNGRNRIIIRTKNNSWTRFLFAFLFWSCRFCLECIRAVWSQEDEQHHLDRVNLV